MNRQQQIARVEALVDAAKQLTDRDATGSRCFCDALVSTTGLSRQGVELALREHLETEPSTQEIESLVDWAGSATRVHVVLSAHVFTAGLRALALAAAAAPSVCVRCSSREREFVPALLSHIRHSPTRESFSEVAEIDVQGGEEVHLYGSDQSLMAICSRLPRDSVVRAHGTGIGVALVGRGIAPEEAARKLASDMIVFDQRGCLSPRLVLVEGWSHAQRVSVELSRHLCLAEEAVPTGEIAPEERAERARFRGTGQVIGEWLGAGRGGVVLTRPLQSTWIAPVGRFQVVVGCEERENVFPMVGPLARHVAAIGMSGNGDDFFRAVLGLCPAARVSELGRMQRPGFDGPVDRRHSKRESPSQVVSRLQG